MENEACTLLAMVAVHFEYPQLGGLSDEQKAAIYEWYERYRSSRLSDSADEAKL